MVEHGIDRRPVVGYDRYRQRGALPQIVIVDLGRRYIEAGANAVEQRVYDHPFGLERLSLQDVQIECQYADEHLTARYQRVCHSRRGSYLASRGGIAT